MKLLSPIDPESDEMREILEAIVTGTPHPHIDECELVTWEEYGQ